MGKVANSFFSDVYLYMFPVGSDVIPSGALNESVPSNICSWDDFLLAGKLFLCSYSPGK